MDRWTPACISIDIYSRDNGAMGHTVYTKATYMNLYLNTQLHCCPVNILSVLSTLAHRARAVCNQHSLLGELNTLQSTLHNNRHSQKKSSVFYIHHRMSDHQEIDSHQSPTQPCSRALQLHQQNAIKNKIKTVALPPRITSGMMHPVKDNLGLTL
jgi:hypothetical protein